VESAGYAYGVKADRLKHEFEHSGPQREYAHLLGDRRHGGNAAAVPAASSRRVPLRQRICA